ncbi:pseudouridine synthase [uncultured Catenibacterium sp.]|uniref:pseudouridine synthase n=1 Tax=uncultured Catenibacterium sp. TaxID=286142 RepID=UPI0025E98BDB|nr:pseudouridine synthase [uncultured Catenibacterium sp.]
MRLIDIFVLNKCGSKKQAKKAIKKGLILVNNHTIEEDIDITDETVIYDSKILDPHPLKYYIIHKPSGYVCANRDPHDPCLISLLPDDNLHYVGRLDRDTTGLVIMTNDLKLRKRLTLPEFHIPRTYAFTCLYPLKDIAAFKEGIIIDGDVKCLPALVEMKSDHEGMITLEEGRYHEIKKMFLSLDNKITSLHRVMYGDISLGDLPSGAYRTLTKEEINHLKDITGREICNISKK